MLESAIPETSWRTYVVELDNGLVQINIERLETAGELGALFAGLYQESLEIYPELKDVIIYPMGKADSALLAYTGGMARHQGRGDGIHPEIKINTNDGWEHYAELARTRPISTKLSAEKAGIPISDFSPKELAGFIFLHELGHTMDYLTRSTSIENFSRKRKEEMQALPIPGYNPVKLKEFLQTVEGRAYFLKDKEALRAQFGVRNTDELLFLQESAYHNMETEDFADQFASRMIQRLMAKQNK